MYPKIEKARLLPNTFDANLLLPLAVGFTLCSKLSSSYLMASFEGRRYTLAMSEEGFLVGFESLAPGSTASFLCAKTGLYALETFWQGIHSPEEIEEFFERELLPELSDAEVASLPMLARVGEAWVALKSETRLPGGFLINY